MNLDEYRAWYLSEYKKPPPWKCIEDFIKLHPEETQEVETQEVETQEVETQVPEDFWRETELDG